LFRALSLIILGLALFLAPSSPASAQASTPAAAPESGNPAVFEQDVIKQGYDLLLDRYVQQLNPADLLGATYTGVVKALGEAGVQVKESSPLLLEQNRERAYATFRSRLNTLLQESPAPPGFDVNAAALTAMTKSLDEGHTAYLTPQQFQDFVATMRGDLRYSGIGIRPTRPGVTVAEIFPDSPAARAGLALGDRILAVDGQTTDDKTLEEVAVLIRGPEGSAVKLTVLRPKTGEQLEFNLTRASIKYDFISTGMVQDSVAYVRIRGFSEPSIADRFEQFMDSLPSSTRGLVIDLRGNSGGRIDVGLRILNHFIDTGPLFDQVDRSGRHRVQNAIGPGLRRSLPVAVLTDEGSASMSEIFASALREHGVARIIGKPTAGVVAGAQAFPLSDGSALLVTVMEIFSGNGERLNRVGVQPDQVVETSQEDFENGRDVPLEAAVLYVWSESDRITAQSSGG
jgi:carboxyl-terminal processing protease